MVKLINESSADIGKDVLKENSDVDSLFFNIEKSADITERLNRILKDINASLDEKEFEYMNAEMFCGLVRK